KNPQANGVIERVHRTINNKLRTTAISNRGEWENCLSSVMFALRAQYHTMTKMSPSQAVFGREMLFDVPSEVDWQRQQKHKELQVKRVEIINMDDGTSAEAARIVDQQWFNRYPRPERCIYDQGPEFRAEFQELLQSYGVEYAGNTAKKPQAKQMG
ncbi:Rapid-growth-like protein 25, partial [Phytophthora megakarya]